MPGRVTEALTQDVRHALRAAVRTPALTLVVILSLGLGIGANAAVFSVISAVMLREMPVRDPAQLVEPRSRYPGDPPMNFFAWPSHFAGARTLSDVAGVGPARLQVSCASSQPSTGFERTAPAAAQPPGGGLATEIVNGEYVTGDLFPMLGVQPALERFIGQDDEAGEAVVVTGWEFWRRRFERDPGVIGRRIGVHGVPATVIGIAPRG